MPERAPEAASGAGARPAAADATADELRRRVADLVVEDPGVDRIEPTLTSALRSLGEDHDPADAIRLDLRSRVADVELSVAAAGGQQVRELAHRLQDGVVDLVAAAGLVAGDVDIHVLSIASSDRPEPVPAG